MRLSILILFWILGMACLDRFAFAADSTPYNVPATQTALMQCPGGICPANVTGATPAAYGGGGERRGMFGRPVRRLGRVLTAPFRLFRGCRRGGC